MIPAVDKATDVKSVGFGRLTRDSVVFAVGAVSGKVIGVALLPVFTRFLSPDEFGRFDLLSAMGSAAISVLLLGVNVVATRLAVDDERTEDERRALMGSWLLIQLGVLIPPSLVLLIGADAIARALFGPAATGDGVRIVGLITFAGTLHYVALTILRFQQRAVGFTALSAGTLGLNAVLVIVMLSAWVQDERAPLLAYGLSLAAGALFGFAVIGRRRFGMPTVHSTRMLLVLGLPLLPAIALTWIADFANRGVLLGSAGADELGYFSVALRFASIGAVAVAGFQLAWQPRAFAYGTSSAALTHTAADAHRIVLIASGVVVIIAVASPELVAIVSGQAFAPSLPALGLSLCGVLATAGYLVTSMPSALAHRFRDIGISSAVGVGTGLVLNLVLAPQFGSSGAALAAAVGQTTATALVWLMGRRTVLLPIPWPRTAKLAVLASVVALLSTLPVGGAAPLVRAVGFAAFAIVVWRDGALQPLVRSATSRLH